MFVREVSGGLTPLAVVVVYIAPPKHHFRQKPSLMPYLVIYLSVPSPLPF